MSSDNQPTLSQIMQAVSEVYRIGKLDILSMRRAPHICEARFVFYWLARYQTAKTFDAIGRGCGGRDHTTVRYGIMKVDKDFPRYREKLRKIAGQLGVDLAYDEERLAA